MTDPREPSPAQEAPSVLTLDRVRRIAALCRLRLNEAELERERVRLDAVLGYMAQLRGTQPGEAEARNDADAESSDLDLDRALNLFGAPVAPDEPGVSFDPGVVARLAPESVGPYIRVPRVLDEGGA